MTSREITLAAALYGRCEVGEILCLVDTVHIGGVVDHQFTVLRVDPLTGRCGGFARLSAAQAQAVIDELRASRAATDAIVRQWLDREFPPTPRGAT